MLANHETGAVQPVRVLANTLAARRIPAALHCDAVQAVGKLPVSYRELGVTTLSLSAHKFHGPKGVGALLVRTGIKLRPMFLGGHQQMGRRPGTESVALAVGLTTALELALQDRKAHWEHVLRLREAFHRIVGNGAPPVVLNGPDGGGLPHTLNLSFPGVAADSLLMNLDLAGVACSTGSACSSGSLLPSPVLKAMGVPPEVLTSAMRFSFSALLTQEEVEEAARRVVEVVHRLRATGTLE
jgi:cysteine desulfurase